HRITGTTSVERKAVTVSVSQGQVDIFSSMQCSAVRLFICAATLSASATTSTERCQLRAVRGARIRALRARAGGSDNIPLLAQPPKQCYRDAMAISDQDAVARHVAGGLLACLLAACNGGGDGGGDRAVPPVQASVASMDAIGDSISKGFNAVSGGETCPESEIESRNFSTGDTHGMDFCSDGGEGVFSHAEQLECVQAKQIVRADPNS